MKAYRSLYLAALLLTPLIARSETSVPADVQRFIEQAELCQHLAGEWDSSLPEPDKKEIEAGITQHCSQAEKQLSALRSKYHEDRDIMTTISGYSL